MTVDRVSAIKSKLTVAREKLTRCTEQRDALVRRADDRHWTETDPAIGSGIRRKPNRKADARRYAGYDRDVQVFVDYEAAHRLVSILIQRLGDAMTERDRVLYTAADLVGATHVRDQFGWHRVVRVNAKSVTVETGYSWTDRIEVADILDVRTVTP